MPASKVTFEVPPELRDVMDGHPEVNWSAVFRDAVSRHARALEIAKRIRDEEEDPRVRDVAARVKRGTARRYQRAVDARRR